MKKVKELLSQIASTVRLKTGKTEKLTIEQMAKAINGITVSGDIGFTSGTFISTSSSTAATIQHGLKQVPGALVFVKYGSAISTLPSNVSSRTEALFSAVTGEAGHVYCYASVRRGYSGTGSSATTSTRSWIYSNAMTNIFGSGGNTSSYFVTNINEDSFTTPKSLSNGAKYIWIAFRAPLVS